MKNITVSIDDEVYRQARIAAAERDTSVSALVRDFLVGLGRSRGDEVEAANSLFAALDQAREFRAGDRLSRDESHVR